MNEVEMIIALDKEEINLWRLANSQSAATKEWETAALVLLACWRVCAGGVAGIPSRI
jgi:hypothetical protein